MTQQVHRGYRNHRKATWGLALLLVVAAAAAVIPLASGASDKTYTLGIAPSSCASSTDGATSTVVTLTNTAKTATLGSAEIYFPANSIDSVSQGIVRHNVSGAYPGPWDIIGGLNSLGLSKGAPPLQITVFFKAGGFAGPVQAVVKQSNNFNDTSGTANLFANPTSWPQLSVATCQYTFFPGQPVDTTKGSAQTVKVQLRSGNTPVSVAGSLNLSAYQTISGTPTQVNSFAGLASIGDQDSSKTWSFSVIGNVSGQGYTLRAGSGSQARDSNSFAIYDCIPDASNNCNIPFTQSDASGSSGGSTTGSQIGSGIALSFSSTLGAGGAICQNRWGWSQLKFPAQPPDGRTTFDGITLSDFSYANTTGFLKVTTYLRNDLFVQTTANQTNDIQMCAGARHAASANGASNRAFMGRNGVLAQWDPITPTGGTDLYWGVLARTPNCNKVPDFNGDEILDPALCAWGTQTINGVDYRTATVLVPYDWDWKGGI